MHSSTVHGDRNEPDRRDPADDLFRHCCAGLQL